MNEKKKILVVDDDSICRLLYEKALKDYQVDCVDSAEKILCKLLCDHYDLIIMDIKLPGMSGPEAAHMIKKRIEIPIALISGYPLTLAYVKDTVDFTMEKPIDIELLRKNIKNHLYHEATT